jgi:5,10-methylenetetrahydromethanopterin reductase
VSPDSPDSSCRPAGFKPPARRTHALELGLGFQGDKSTDAYAELARLGEELGFDVLSVYADLFYQPAIYPLLVMALHTSEVRLGPASLNPFTLHPVEIAGQIAALDQASGGRAFLGLVRGGWLDRLGLEQRGAVAAVRDALEIVRRLLRGDSDGYSGERFSLAPGARLAYPTLRPQVPILVGTWSRRTSGLAAQMADEVKIGGSANPAMVRQMRDWLEPELQRQSRAQDAVGIVVGAVTVVDRDGPAARRLGAMEVAMYLDVVLELDPTLDVPAGLLGSIRQHLREGDREGAGRRIPADVLDLFAFCGTPEQICRQVEDISRAGAKRIDFGTPHGISEIDGIRLLGERVVPNFR